jgi:two-component sensor histidine kinase
MAARVAAHDWASTPLGARAAWPQSLRTAVDIVLGSGHAMQLAWGPDRIIVYNDAYAPMLGARHPSALGKPLREAWPDVWEHIDPLVARVAAGETVSVEAMPLATTRHGYAEESWWNFCYSPLRDESGAVAGLLNVPTDVTARVDALRAETERDAANALLQANEGRLRALLDASSDVIYRMSPDWTRLWRIEGDFPGFDAIAPDLGWVDAHLFAEDRGSVLGAIRRAIERKATFELEHRVRRADGSEGWVFSRAVPILDRDGRISEWFGLATDITARREGEARQGALLAELQHRTRNLMAVIRAMSDLSLRASEGLDDFRERFHGRLDALSRVQDMLSRLGECDRVGFDELVRAELAAVHDDPARVVLDGPTGIRLRSTTLQTLALAIHELATNAVKHGALAQSGGRLAVRWRLEPDGPGGRPWLHVDWRETGADMRASTQRARGHGRRLVEHALPYQLGARTLLVATPEGMHCTLRVPVSASTCEGTIDG